MKGVKIVLDIGPMLGLEKSNSVNYPGLDYIISDVYEMYNALCSYGFQEPIEVVKTVAELKNQAENK